MDTFNLIMRQQQIAMEKSREMDALGKRDYFPYLVEESKKFLEDKNPNKKIILIPGLRGIGKTTLLHQLYYHLLNVQKIDNKQIFFFTMDEMSGFETGMKELISTIERDITSKPLAMEKRKMVFILDEVHYAKDWALNLKLLYDQCYDVLIIGTGSSSLKLNESADLARRRVMKPLYPFSLKEYLELNHYPVGESFPLKDVLMGRKKPEDLKELWTKNLQSVSYIRNHGILEDYLIHGGFPFRKDEEMESIFDLISKIIHKDIEETMENIDSLMVEKLVNYLAISRAGETSAEKASNKLGISKPSILKYLELLEKAELVFSVKPFARSSVVVRSPTKYYFASSSLKASILFRLMPDIRRSETIGELLESSIFSSIRNNLALSGIDFQVFYDPDGCDFIIQFENGMTAAIEVKKGKSSSFQINKSMVKSNAGIGIVLSSSNEVRSEGKLIFIPRELFLVM